VFPTAIRVAPLSFLMLMLVVPRAEAARLRVRGIRSRDSAGVTMRKRLHVNDLIAEPGTVEVDWGGLYSNATYFWTLPSAVKYTPEGGSLFRGRTEYSIAFDSVASIVDVGIRSIQFSDHMTFAATSIIYDSPHFDVAVSPQVTAFLRDESGTRVGATTIARYDGARNSLAVALGWSGATTVTDTNPAGVWDFVTGYSHQLPSKWKRFTPHLNTVLERPTGAGATLTGYAGVEYQLNERFAIDAATQRSGLSGGRPDQQFLLSFTTSFGNGKRNVARLKRPAPTRAFVAD
jgi:hypothetical protein